MATPSCQWQASVSPIRPWLPGHNWLWWASGGRPQHTASQFVVAYEPGRPGGASMQHVL